MRIALLSLHFSEYSLHLARALATENDVLLVLEKHRATGELGDDFTRFAVPGLRIEVVEFDRTPKAIVDEVRAIAGLLRRFTPDVVHVQETHFDALAILLPVIGRLPYVLTVHDPSPHSGEEDTGLLGRRRELYRLAHRRRADMAITHGAVLAGQLARVSPHLAGRIADIPHGPLGDLPGDPPAADVVPGRFLFLGRMHPYKGLAVFVEAIAMLVARGRPVEGVIAGRGPALADMRDQVTGVPHLTVREEYLSRADMLGLVDSADALALPYLDGTQSGIALLAMGRGRCCIASDVGSLGEVVRDGETGVLVPPGSAAALAEAFEYVLYNPLEAARLREGVVADASGRFSWQTIAQATTDAYRAAAAHRQAQGSLPKRVLRRALGLLQSQPQNP